MSFFSDIPVFPTITATVTFQEFRYDEFEDSIFIIPAEYKEDPTHFPDLWPVRGTEVNPQEAQRDWGKTEHPWMILIFLSFTRLRRGKKTRLSLIIYSADVSEASRWKKTWKTAVSGWINERQQGIFCWAMLFPTVKVVKWQTSSTS